MASPPISAEDLENYSKTSASWEVFLVICLVAIVCSGGCFLIYRKLSKPDLESNNRIKKGLLGYQKVSYRSNAVYLFGQLDVFDKHNRSIFHLFSLRLKQASCLILKYIEKEGITSQWLSDKLWSGRSEDKVKNSRGTTRNSESRKIPKFL